MDAFLFGAALAILTGCKKYEYFLQIYKNKLLLFSIILFVALYALTVGLPPSTIKANQFAYPILSIVFTLIVNHSLYSKVPNFIVRLSNFGKLSYSVYLLKLPLIYFIYKIMLKNLPEIQPVLFVLLFLVLSISINYIVSAFWHYGIDLPVRTCCSNLLNHKH
jgi:peptidoglycan/LPS O-acetylase OafA/YrhL